MTLPQQPTRPVRFLSIGGIAERRRTPAGRWRLHVRWGRVALILIALAVLGWTAKSAALYYVFKWQRGFDDIRIAEVVRFPLNRATVRERLGNHHIEMAHNHLEAGDYRSANYYARLGLVRSPGNVDGRLLVAQFSAFTRPDLAVRVLEEGLDYAGENVDYLRTFLRLLLHLEMDDKVRAVAAERLPLEPELTLYNRMLALAAAQANFHRGAYDRAEELVTRFRLDTTAEGTVLLSRIDWNRGQRESAVHRLERFSQRAPGPEMDPVYALITRYYREMDRLDSARRFGIIRSLHNPHSAHPRIDLLYLAQRAGEHERVEREAAEILAQFPRDQAALRALAVFAKDSGNTKLAGRIFEQARNSEFDPAVFKLLHLESHIVAGAFESVIQACNELLQQNPEWLEQHMPSFHSLRSIAYYGAGNRDLGAHYLDRYLQSGTLRVNGLLAVSRYLRNLDLPRVARRVLSHGHRMEPSNQAALSAIVELDLEQGESRELAHNLRELLLLRRPSYDLLRRAYRELSSDRFLFAPERENLLDKLGAALAEANPPPER